MKKFIKRNKTILMTLVFSIMVATSGYCIYNVELERNEMLQNYETRIQELEYKMKTLEDSNKTLKYVNEDYKKENSTFRLTIDELQAKSDYLSNQVLDLEALIAESQYYDSNNHSRGSLVEKPLDKYGVISIEELNTWISERAPEGSIFLGNAEVFLDAAKESGLDPKYLIAHAGLESGWGSSDISINKHNYFGISAFNHDPYNSAMEFSSFREGIIEGAKWIQNNFTSVGQDTLHSMIYGDSTHTYAVYDDGTPNQGWIDKIIDIIL